ncbi:MAG: SpoVR family protein, partial [Hyphomicrobiales bacterium]|nr:SpoVR family protein [Hyphomicrobiales bacterium]
LSDKADQPHYLVEAIHDADGYRRVREILAESYDVGASEPDIQVADVDLLGNRELILQHNVRDGVRLDAHSRDETMRYVRRLWGYGVRLEEVHAAA